MSTAATQEVAPNTGHAADPSASDAERNAELILSEDILSDESPADFGQEPDGDHARPGEIPTEEPPAQQDTAPEETTEEPPAKLAGKYESVEQLESAHGNLEKVLGRQGAELRKTREDLARLEGQVEGQRQVAPPGASPDQIERENSIRVLTADNEAIGMDAQEARTRAENQYAVFDQMANRRVANAVSEFRPYIDDARVSKESVVMAGALRDETDAEGNLLRPDWNEVVKTTEFAGLMQANQDKLASRDGIENLYLRARTASSVADTAREQKVASDAEQVVADEKARAASATGGASGDDALPVSTEDPEVQAIYDLGKDRPPLMGGSWE